MTTQILNEFHRLTQEYEVEVKVSMLEIKSIFNIVNQKKATAPFLKRRPIQGSIDIDSYIPSLNNELKFLNAFPGCLDILVHEQTSAITKKLESVSKSVQTMEKIVYSLIDLQRIATSKAPTCKAKPTGISFFECCVYLENQVLGYKLDLIQKQNMLAAFDVSNDDITLEWDLCESIDQRDQERMLERLKLTIKFNLT